jgi:hypothetical protein
VWPISSVTSFAIFIDFSILRLPGRIPSPEFP